MIRLRSSLGRFLPGPAQPINERFWAKVSKSDGCWIWTGARNRDGYGFIKSNGKMIKSSRMAYELIKGPIPDGLIIRHTCDNPPCVNPEHLILGTHKDNTRDMFERGRNVIPDMCRAGQALGAKTRRVRTMFTILPAVLEGIRLLERNEIKPTFHTCTKCVPWYNGIRSHFSHSQIITLGEERSY